MGVCKPEELNLLTINVQCNDGFRNANAWSRRFFVTLKGKPLCSVKAIPQNGIYSVNDIIQTQKLFSNFSGFTAPSILGIYKSNNDNAYIVEECISQGINLEHAIKRGDVLPCDAELIMDKLFEEVASQPSIDQNPHLLTKELHEFISAAELLSIPHEFIKLLKDSLDRNVGRLAGRVIRTTRDLLPRNILISSGKPVVVDYDLSRQTHFLWLDICRKNYYTKDYAVALINQQYLPEGIDPMLIYLLFCLSEIKLQHLVLDNNQFLCSIESLKNTTISYLEKVFPETLNNGLIYRLKSSLPVVDGKPPLINGINQLQLFWDSRGTISEQESLKVPLLEDGNFHKYDLPIPSEAIGQLRLDPVNHPAYVEIKSIELFAGNPGAENNILLTRWVESTNFSGIIPCAGIVILENQENFRFISFHKDPQLLLSGISESKVEGPRFLRVIMCLSESIPEFIINELNTKKVLIENLNSILGSRSWKLTAPLRWGGKKVKYLIKLIRHAPEMFKFTMAAIQLLYSEIYRVFFDMKAQLAHKRLANSLNFPLIEKPIDIIIPIYNAYDDLVACVESVLTNTSSPFHLMLIDDASSDPRIGAYFEKLESRSLNNLSVIRNQENLGFVGTVNRGMAESSGHVVLLNSDTEVPPGWLERLYSVAKEDQTIGTVTPFSNNATICSFPNFCQDNILPEGYDVAELDTVFKNWAPRSIVNLPTAVGFCMLITRQCLEAVGMFDHATFGRGYGEENDFCVRAERLGFRNVLCPRVFVYHKGSMSFGVHQKKLAQENLQKLQKKHPAYSIKVREFIEEDPIRPIRQVIQSGLTVSRASKTSFGILFVLHSLGGGTERHVEDLIKVIKSHVRVYVLKAYSGRFELIDRNSESPFIYTFPIEGKTENTILLRKLALTFDIRIIHVHNVIGYPIDFLDSIIELEIPYSYTAHDYYSACPSFNLLDPKMNYCNANTNKEICRNCLEQQPNYISTPISDIGNWRTHWLKFLKGAKVVFTPSKATAENLIKYYPDLKITSIEHGIDPFVNPANVNKLSFLGTFGEQYRLRVAFLGAIGPNKGSQLLEELVELSRKTNLPIQWIVVGFTDLRQGPYRSLDNRLIVHGAYANEQIPELMRYYNVDLVFLPAISPETYSYTLSEAWLAGYPVMAADLGALGQRIRDTDAGWLLVDLDTNVILKALMNLVEHPEQIQNMRKKVKKLTLPNLESMGSQYLRLYQEHVTDCPQFVDTEPFSPEVLLEAVQLETPKSQKTGFLAERQIKKIYKFYKRSKLRLKR